MVRTIRRGSLDRVGEKARIRVRKREIEGPHGLRQLPCPHLGVGRGIHQQSLDLRNAQQPRRNKRFITGSGASARPVPSDVGSAVREQHHGRRAAPALHTVGKEHGHIDAGGQRRSTAPGQAREAALGPDQGAGRRQQQLRPLTPKRNQGDAIPAYVTARQQQLDGTLGLREPV